MTVDPKDAAIESLQRSGFPFQTAVEEIVSTQTAFNVRESEFPWLDRHRADQFLDLVFNHNSLYVALECKKTEKEILTFLLPEGSNSRPWTSQAHVVLTRQVRDATHRLLTYNVVLDLEPKSPKAEFCVVATEKAGKNLRLLERDCRLLLAGNDAYARRRREELDEEARKLGGYETYLIHVPVLVTNAPLFVASYDPSQLSLETGRFDELPDVEQVPTVRLTKSFAAPTPRDLGNRTVFVVSAAALPTFLGKLRAHGNPAGISGGIYIE